MNLSVRNIMDMPCSEKSRAHSDANETKYVTKSHIHTLPYAIRGEVAVTATGPHPHTPINIIIHILSTYHTMYNALADNWHTEMPATARKLHTHTRRHKKPHAHTANKTRIPPAQLRYHTSDSAAFSCLLEIF